MLSPMHHWSSLVARKKRPRLYAGTPAAVTRHRSRSLSISLPHSGNRHAHDSSQSCPPPPLLHSLFYQHFQQYCDAILRATIHIPLRIGGGRLSLQAAGFYNGTNSPPPRPFRQLGITAQSAAVAEDDEREVGIAASSWGPSNLFASIRFLLLCILVTSYGR